MKVPISSVAEMLNVHPRTLRLWDEEGIVKPERSPKNRRLYTEQNIEEARAVSFMLNEMGLNINGVKCILGLHCELNKYTNGSVKPLSEFIVLLSAEIGLTTEQMQANKQSNKSKGRKKANP